MEEKRRSKRSKTIDEGYWDCTVCTYKNSPEAFKCEMCDVRKGTSTRKPRLNAQLVAQQVAQQYAPPPKKEKSSTDPGSDGGEVIPPSINTRERENTTRERTSGGGGTFEKVEKEKEKKRHSHPNHASTKKEKNNNSATTSSTPTTNSNKKIRPPRLKNIDRSSFTTMEVTVGSVTVIITDYKPKNKERRTSSDNQLSNTNSDSGESSLSHLSSTDIKKDLSDVEMADEPAC